jgi:hypothetical protein
MTKVSIASESFPEAIPTRPASALPTNESSVAAGNDRSRTSDHTSAEGDRKLSILKSDLKVNVADGLSVWCAVWWCGVGKLVGLEWHARRWR